MSIRMMAEVWDNGPSNQGELLVLLALADFADDDGFCWPSVAAIASKARIEERSARRVIRRLEEAGWLSVKVGRGRHGCSEYRIKPGPKVPRTECPPDIECTKPGPAVHETRTPRSPEPSGTVKNRQEEKNARDAQILNEAVDAYNAAAERSGWPSCQKLSKQRTSALLGRLKEAGGLDGWLVALGKAEASDFLCGRRETGRGVFFASFDFLTRQSSFAKLMEGTYDNRASRIQQPRHADGSADRPDPALANILRLAGLGEAQGSSRH